MSISLYNVLKVKKLDSILFFSRENIRYLCGFTGSSGMLLYRNGENIFFTDSRYLEQAKHEVRNAKVKLANRGAIDVCNFLSSDGIKMLGIEASSVSYQNFIYFQRNLRRTKIYPLTDELDELRAVKNKDEIKAIKKALKIAEASLKEVIKILRDDVSESEIAIEIEYLMKLKGSEELPFNTIVLFGKNSSLPHGRPGKRKLKKGDFILIDFGARYNGYCSDETVTFVYKKASKEQERVYTAVNDARKYAIELIRDGVKTADVDKAVRGVLDKHGLSKFFGHGLGHGVGLAIHESPRLAGDSKTVLKKGMVVTVEPGVYIPGWGGVRLEDMVVVEEKGAKIITGFKKEFRIIDG